MSISGRSSSLTPNKSKRKYFQPEGDKKLTSSPFSIPRFFNVQQIQPYKNQNQPKFTNQKREAILKRVEIEKEAKVVSQTRIKSKDHFYRYKKNPFMNLSQQDLYTANSNKQKKQPKVHRSQYEELQHEQDPSETLVQALLAPKILKKDNISQQFRKVTEQLSGRISNSISPVITKSAISLKPTMKQAVKERELSFQQITQLSDENFYTNKLGQINIFSFMKGKILPTMTNYQILEKYHFSFASNVQKNEKIKVPIFRDLSKTGREFVLNKFKGSFDSRLQFLRSTQISVNWSKLRLEDVLSIVSGRMSSKLAYHLMNDIDKNKDLNLLTERSEISMTEVMYNENANQKLINFNIEKEEWQEVMYYKELQNTPQQIIFAKKCSYFHQNLKKELRVRGKLCENAIKDSVEHRKFKQAANQQCESLFNLKSIAILEKDRLVRLNKANKNRNDAIKVRQMIESLVLKNKAQTEMEIILRKKGKDRMI